MHVRYAIQLIGFSLLIPVWLFGQANNGLTDKTTASDSVQLWTLRHVGDSLIDARQFDQAKKVFEQSLTLAQQTDQPGLIGLSYRAMGYWYETIGDYTRAIVYFQQAMNEFRKTNNPRYLARTMSFISHCYAQLNDYKRALNYADAGLKIAQQAGLEDVAVQFYSGMARLAANRKDIRQVDWYTNKELDFYKKKKDWRSYYAALYNAALTNKNEGQYAIAEQRFRQVEYYASEQKSGDLLGNTQSSIPSALIPQNKLDEAERYCQLALTWVEKTSSHKNILLEDINGFLSQIAERRGHFEQALLFYKRQMAYKDSVFNEAKNNQLAELEVRYQTQQNEASIKQLAATNALQTRQIWAGLGGLLALTALLGMLYWLYQRVRQSRTQIQHQSDQLALMMKELHHRVKNNLAIVSSLLKLQSNRLEDEKALQAVRTGQQRVEAMSLIHQRLYQTDQVTTVNIREYLTDLAESLMQAYDYIPDDFDLSVDVDQKELDVDVAIPLGLIANELITNAFKYAYNGMQRPSLRISLRDNEGLTLEVQDNGPGIDPAFWHEREGRSSFGKRLINSLSEELNGRLDLIHQDGALFRLNIPTTRLRVI